MNSIMERDEVQYKGKETSMDSTRERDKQGQYKGMGKSRQYKGKGTNRDSIWENERGMKGPGSKE